MSTAFPYLVIVVALASIALARKSDRPIMSSIAWLLVAGGFALLTWTDATVAMAVSVSAIAGFAAVPATGAANLRMRIAAFTGVVPVALTIGAIVCVMDATTVWGGKMVLYAAAWGALVAAASAFVAAGAVVRRPVSVSLPVAMAASFGAVLVAGSGRSSLPEAFYGISLRTGDEALQWVLDPVPGFETGMRLSVAAPAEQIHLALTAFVFGTLVLAVLVLRRKAALSKRLLGLLTLGVGGLLAAIPSIISSLTLPPTDAYGAEVKRRLLTSRGGSQILDAGHFTSTADVSVSTADLAPEIIGLAFAVLLGIVGVLAMHKDSGEGDAADRLHARDLLARGLAFLWAGWLLLLVIHNGFLGAPGMGSPAEWVFTGICLSATGLVITTWDEPTTKFGRLLGEVTPGIVIGLLLLGAGLAWRFGALPGLSLGVF